MWKRGQWLAVCDRCGFQYLSGSLKLMWNGLRTCDACWETRHPQEFVHGIKESVIPWSRPEPEGINVSPFQYVDSGYWDEPSVVPPAVATTDRYVDMDGMV